MMACPGQHLVPGGFLGLTDGWVRSPRQAAVPTEEQILQYLQSSGMRCDRQLSKGRRFRDEGYIRNIMFNEISPVSEVGVFRCICLPSMKGGYYIVHAVAEKTTGDITEAHCHCPAGLSGTCQHVVGLLLAVVGAAAEPEPTCTDLPCAWIVPSSAKKVEVAKPLSDITFKTTDPNGRQGFKRKRSYDPCPNGMPSDAGCFRRKLQNAFPRALWLRYNKEATEQPSVSLEANENEQPTAEVTSAHQGVPALMDLIKEHCQLTGPEFLAYIKQAYTGEDISQIEEKTKLQSLSSQWMVYRRGMVTASRARACLTRTRSLDKEPRPHNLRGIVNLVLQSATFKSSAMNEGLRKEAEAKAFYISNLEKSGHTASIADVGLTIFREVPIVGASPDGIVTSNCECCMGTVRVLEVKCPLQLKNSFKDLNEKKPKLIYQTQMNVTMGILNIPECDFIVYCNKDEVATVTIKYDAAGFNEFLQAAQKLFIEYLYPALQCECT
ncbi:uncharacterized protein LOC144113849 [Amblyomma americanum]